MKKQLTGRPVYIVDGARSPFLKATGPNALTAADLAVQTGQALLSRQRFSPDDIDHVVIGCAAPSQDEMNIARIISLRVGCGHHVPAFTVQRNCASGMQALDSAAQLIASGRHDLILSGGTEAMSHAPLLWRPELVQWMIDFQKAKTWPKKLRQGLRFPLRKISPILAILRGLNDPVACLSMGQTAEIVADQFGITRQEMDAFAVESHQRAAAAQKAGHFDEETVAISSWKGELHASDDGVRDNSSMERLGKLKPVFDKPFGQVTAGNSSQISDGAALLLLASEKAIEKHGLTPLAKITDVAWAGVDPQVMGLGPVHAMSQLLMQQKLGCEDIDFWELNEAFAAQVLGCLSALNDEAYCKKALSLKKAFGTIKTDQLNVDGGSIALGHPVGASGARVVLHLVHLLKRTDTKRGVASLCIGGGQGGAMLIERIVSEENA